MVEFETSSPYSITFGVVIAGILIFFIALLHVCRCIFKQIKKRNELRIVPMEIQIPKGERRISSAVCIKLSTPQSKAENISVAEGLEKSSNTFNKNKEREKLIRGPNYRKEDGKLYFIGKNTNEDMVHFFAGYSHLNEDF